MIIALSGPSGIGKGYVKEAILTEEPKIKEAVWYTTREPRANEKNRKSISDAEFNALENAGELVLVQNIFGHRYAISKTDLLSTSEIVMTEIHPSVIEKAKEVNPGIHFIGMVTGDIELLRERLAVRRKTESSEEIGRRVEAAVEEIRTIQKQSSSFDAIIYVERNNETKIAQIARGIFRAIIEKEGL